MALVKATLKAVIKAALLNARNETSDADAAADALAGSIADGIDTYVKAMTITYTVGLIAPSGGGPVTGSFTYTIS